MMKEFMMKDLISTKFSLELQNEHLKDIRILVHHSNYVEKVLKMSYIDKAHQLN